MSTSKSEITLELSYKPYIDGLRACAVTFVILFHLNPNIFSGGYLGVDIFFVISGFVITQSLYKDYLIDGTISFAQFYIRRFKRIYPLLITVIISTLILFFLFGHLTQTHRVIKSGFFSIIGLSNLYYLKKENDYFVSDAEPFLHTWSLGVEEQFYFIFPF